MPKVSGHDRKRQCTQVQTPDALQKIRPAEEFEASRGLSPVDYRLDFAWLRSLFARAPANAETHAGQKSRLAAEQIAVSKAFRLLLVGPTRQRPCWALWRVSHT